MASTPAPAAAAHLARQASSSAPPGSFAAKRIEFNNPGATGGAGAGADAASPKERTVLMQSRNGPCPLLALANVLSLRGALDVGALATAAATTTTPTTPSQTRSVAFESLVQAIAGKLIDANAKLVESSANAQALLDEALGLLPSLLEGLDVNVRFEGVDKFEFTKALSVFDMLDIRLLHGWVIDEQDAQFGALRKQTYDQTVELALADEGGDSQRVALGLTAKAFLSETASQLTYTGLSALHTSVRPNELCVLFRGNHFSVMYRHPVDGHLYLLCTDAGFAFRPTVAWERLTDVDGNTELVSPTFGDPNAYLSPWDRSATGGDMTSDSLLAMQLQMEEDDRSNGRQGQGHGQQPVQWPAPASIPGPGREGDIPVVQGTVVRRDRAEPPPPPPRTENTVTSSCAIS